MAFVRKYQPGDVKLDRATLERYVQLEQRIHEEESKNTLKALTLKEQQYTDIEATVKQKQVIHDQTVQSTYVSCTTISCHTLLFLIGRVYSISQCCR